jgi:sugar lactone lactonase YvrE
MYHPLRTYLTPSDFGLLLCFVFSLLILPLQAQIISTVAGTGTPGFTGDGGAATSARLFLPVDVAIDGSGNLFIADVTNNRIRKVTAGTGIISTFAGTGTPGFTGDGGAATSARLFSPVAVAVDGSGNVYIADQINQRIRKVTAASGIISTVAGTGIIGFSGDGGAATSARLYTPTDIAVDGSGNLYIADTGNNRIRKITVATGNISTVAGSGSIIPGFGGDGGAATSARLFSPVDIAIDGSGNLYIADQFNQRIRKVTAATGVISTIAGTGTLGFTGDGGAATSARLSIPTAVVLDGAGNIYVTDTGNKRIRKITAATGIISTIAGTGTLGFSGDGGIATSAQLSIPSGMVMSGGNLYVADAGNNRIRLIANAPLPVSLVSFTAQPLPNQTVALNWITSLETNNKGFQIERSKDLHTFETVGEVTEMAPASQTRKMYSLTDLTPYVGTSYYRLSQTDLNGQVTRFPAVSVAFKEGGYGVSPNPVVSGQPFVLRLDEPQTAGLSLYDTQGKVIPFQKVGVVSGNLLLRMGSGVAAGVYVLSVEERGQSRQHRLVVE